MKKREPVLQPAALPLPESGREPLRPLVIEVRGLVKAYQGSTRPAVDGLEMAVGEGEVLGLLGPKGAGKSTAISVMCTLLRPNAGTVVIDGFDVTENPREVRRLIGLVPQETALYPRLTVRRNLRYFGRLRGLRGLDLEERVAAVLDTMRLDEHADRRITDCSGSIKRLANLALAILHRPRFLFLDEPTVGVDPQSRSLILDYLGRLRQVGVTIVYCTPFMEEAQQLCTRVAIMDAGRIIAEGAPSELIAAHPGCASLEGVFLHLTGRHLRD